MKAKNLSMKKKLSFGIAVFLPLKAAPIFLAKKMGALAVRNRGYPILFIIITFLVIPLMLIKIMG